MKTNLCRIRQDILKSGLFVPIGDKYANCSGKFQYRWQGIQFQVYYGSWQNAESIDFDFL